MPETPQPSPAEQKILTQAAIQEVQAALAQINPQLQIDPAAESQQPVHTIQNQEDPAQQAASLKMKYSLEYKNLLQHTVRVLERDDPRMREKLRKLLSL